MHEYINVRAVVFGEAAFLIDVYRARVVGVDDKVDALETDLVKAVFDGAEQGFFAEENGWEADVLAATLGLFPDDALAPQWFERMRLFAANSYSHGSDATVDFSSMENRRA